MSAAEKLPELVPLEIWAHAIYGEHAPALNTLRRWAREGRIQPPPRKHGRTYFVAANAEYVDPSKPLSLVQRMSRGPSASKRG